MTIFEKYQTLARDASSSGDRIGAENYLQHAEHYFRLMQAAKQAQQGAQQNGNGAERDNNSANGRDMSSQSSDNGDAQSIQAGQDADQDAADKAEQSSENGASSATTQSANGNGHARGGPPMSPAELVAEVAAMEQARDGSDANEQPTPRRQPRRRRKAPAVEAGTEQPVVAEAADAEEKAEVVPNEGETSAN